MLAKSCIIYNMRNNLRSDFYALIVLVIVEITLLNISLPKKKPKIIYKILELINSLENKKNQKNNNLEIKNDR